MILGGGSNPTLFATSRSQKFRYRVRYSEEAPIRRSLTTYIEAAFSSMSGTISKPQNSYTYIEVKDLDIDRDHDIEYNEFIYVHRHPPVSGVFPWTDCIPYIRFYVQHTVVPAGKWPCPQKKIQVTPKFNLKLICVHTDLSLCMNLHVLSSCSDPLSLSLAQTVCASQWVGASRQGRVSCLDSSSRTVDSEDPLNGVTKSRPDSST